MIGLLVAAVATWSAIALLRSAAHGNAALEFDAIKTGLTVGVGIGGLAALLLTARKQWLNELTHRHNERVARHSQHDADERRVTELYIKAVEQLGGEKAVVRLGGLYGLERLAQNHLQHRQTIVNVICTYLRMPHHNGTTRAAEEESDTDSSASGQPAQDEEREVRLAAQTLLRNHLLNNNGTSPSEQFWDNVSIDLKGAMLENFSLQDCSVGSIDLSNARFIGSAIFSGARFKYELKLTGATFTDTADFDSTRVEGSIRLNEAKFCGRLSFQDAKLTEASFEQSEFIEGASFYRTIFEGPVNFKKVTASASCSFGETKFTDEALFESADFREGAWFTDAEFEDNAQFDSSQFGETAFFTGTTFRQYTTFRAVSFTGGFWCENVEFMSNTRFGGATFAKLSRIENVNFHSHAHLDYLKLNGLLTIVDTTFHSYLEMHDWIEREGGSVGFFDTYVEAAENKSLFKRKWLREWHVVPCEDKPGWGRFISRDNDGGGVPEKKAE
ncbi:pentapeptide repeat-containing protein [Nonomuraea rhodomycinica]|uniref:Pentapeptide repeat-containing protein n=1 Tax=Nonomuraea rhodomycinica TaxID=1712872 RepID=A0A7Y6IXP6_9ACTN|nr:pentapeptide repeat-containing protein [Nonomuraea rhodomycinica]NUW45773.1 pentapeptide repeat-containing protein [Nonomuraea rhodomycinica]